VCFRASGGLAAPANTTSTTEMLARGLADTIRSCPLLSSRRGPGLWLPWQGRESIYAVAQHMRVSVTLSMLPMHTRSSTLRMRVYLSLSIHDPVLLDAAAKAEIEHRSVQHGSVHLPGLSIFRALAP
jgi:hypothetical protein